MRAPPRFDRVWPADVHPWWLPPPLRGMRRWGVWALLVGLPWIACVVWWPMGPQPVPDAPLQAPPANLLAPRPAQAAALPVEAQLPDHPQAQNPADPLESVSVWGPGWARHRLCAREWSPMPAESVVPAVPPVPSRPSSAVGLAAPGTTWRLVLEGGSGNLLRWVGAELLPSGRWALHAWQWISLSEAETSGAGPVAANCGPAAVRVRLDLRPLVGPPPLLSVPLSVPVAVPQRDPFLPPERPIPAASGEGRASRVSLREGRATEWVPTWGTVSTPSGRWYFDAREHGAIVHPSGPGWLRGSWKSVEPVNSRDPRRQPLLSGDAPP